jgi:DNA integrity scanning protein DisA with diadenylate cyclase activity
MSALDDKPPLPNSIETIDELRTFLWQQHEISVGKDDPILLVFSMLRVALVQVEQQNAMSRREMEKSVQSAADVFTRDVTISIKNFKEEAIGDVVRERVQAMSEAARQADRATGKFKKNVFYLGLITAVNLLSAFFMIGLLFSVAR